MKELLPILKRYGACDDLSNENQISQLLFTPKGIEYLENAKLSLSLFREHNVKGIAVDRDIKVINDDIVLVNSIAEISLYGTEKVFNIVLLHGSKAHIKASDYAVINIADINGSYTIEKDETVIVL